MEIVIRYLGLKGRKKDVQKKESWKTEVRKG
jgi:hypothetical protein